MRRLLYSILYKIISLSEKIFPNFTEKILFRIKDYASQKDYRELHLVLSNAIDRTCKVSPQDRLRWSVLNIINFINEILSNGKPVRSHIEIFSGENVTVGMIKIKGKYGSINLRVNKNKQQFVSVREYKKRGPDAKRSHFSKILIPGEKVSEGRASLPNNVSPLNIIVLFPHPIRINIPKIINIHSKSNEVDAVVYDLIRSSTELLLSRKDNKGQKLTIEDDVNNMKFVLHSVIPYKEMGDVFEIFVDVFGAGGHVHLMRIHFSSSAERDIPTPPLASSS